MLERSLSSIVVLTSLHLYVYIHDTCSKKNPLQNIWSFLLKKISCNYGEMEGILQNEEDPHQYIF